MVLRYAPEKSVTRIAVLFYILGGLLLHSFSLAGTILIWKMRRVGYLIFGISSLIIAAYQLFATQISPLTTAFYIGAYHCIRLLSEEIEIAFFPRTPRNPDLFTQAYLPAAVIPSHLITACRQAVHFSFNLPVLTTISQILLILNRLKISVFFK